jgi:hypothetical protein
MRWCVYNAPECREKLIQQTTKENAMFAVFQIEGHRDYQATIALDYTEAQNALHELQSENPKTVFIIQRPQDRPTSD